MTAGPVQELIHSGGTEIMEEIVALHRSGGGE